MTKKPPHPLQTRQSLHLSELGLGNVDFLGIVHFHGAVRPLVPHVHPDTYEICYLARGRQTYVVKGRAYRLRGNDVYVTFPDEDHDTGGCPEEKSLLYYLLVSAHPARSFLGIGGAEGRALHEVLRGLPSRHFRGSPQMRAALDAVSAAFHDPADPLRAARVRTHLLAFFLEMAACSRGAMPTAQTAMDQVCALIARRLGEPIRLEALAREAGLSVSRFKTVFRESVGMPPREYILRETVHEAERRLVASDRPVTEIALDLGFSSSQYFATVFRRFAGCTPAGFRRQQVRPMYAVGVTPNSRRKSRAK